MNKIHLIEGYGFHGFIQLRLRGDENGFILSPAQAKKVSEAICPRTGCQCPGMHDVRWTTAAKIAYHGPDYVPNPKLELWIDED